MYMGLENGTVQLVEMMDRFHAIEDFLGFRYTSNVDCAKKESRNKAKCPSKKDSSLQGALRFAL